MRVFLTPGDGYRTQFWSNGKWENQGECPYSEFAGARELAIELAHNGWLVRVIALYESFNGSVLEEIGRWGFHGMDLYPVGSE